VLGSKAWGRKKIDIPAGCPIQQPLLIRMGEGREQNLVDACEGGVSGHVHTTLAGLCLVQAVPVLIHLVISSIYIRSTLNKERSTLHFATGAS
jgi:hypothetical protein